MAFSEKQIQVNFSLASGEFEGGGNSASFSGLRVSAQIEVTGGPSFATAEIAVYGLPLSLAQQLATVGQQWNARYKNGIDVLAGDAGGSLSLVFSGIIFNAYVEGQNQPDVCLRILASPGVYDSVAQTDPTSVKGSADVAGMIQKLVGKTSLKGFQNNGVSVKLANPYYYGSPMSQIADIASDANVDVAINAGTLTISPRGKPTSGQAPLISPETGLVAYPTFVQNRVIVKALFNPSVQVLGNVQVLSSLQPACGTWQVIRIEYDLESVTPGGAWYMTLDTVPVGTN